ncbi:MAG: HD domain-containing phosphohydrolase [Sterolibacterium sp.]|jgi:response regulator RpfG family c-di-GMP phosphodiesterase
MSEPASLDPAPARLLFVDDEASILASLKRLFRPLGHTIFTATSGRAGLELLEREPIDLVISDMRMPEMDGAAFLEQVRVRRPETVRILLTGYADVSSTVAAINRGQIYRYIAKPWDDQEVLLVVRQALENKRLADENARLTALTKLQNEELKTLNGELEIRVAKRTDELRQTLERLDVAHQKLKDGFLNSVRVFSGLIEMRSGNLGGHARRVAELAREIAGGMGLDEKDTQEIVLAGLLHDIGKLGLADEVLAKPTDKLTQAERNLLVKHPAKGQAVLLAIEPLRGAALLIRHHHERWDGNGFPDGLRGDAIPPGARILAVANDYDGLLSGALLTRKYPPEEARAYLAANSGKRYDARVVKRFLEQLSPSQSVPTRETACPLDALKPGMVLARDLVHPDGYLMLAKGYLLDASLIKLLREFEPATSEQMSIYIRM